jgi:hypothetical protein
MFNSKIKCEYKYICIDRKKKLCNCCKNNSFSSKLENRKTHYEPLVEDYPFEEQYP